jgi:plastocyanin
MKKNQIVLVVGLLAAGACAGTESPVGGTIEITGVDYAFNGVPGAVQTGAELTFTNASAAEVHEIVVLKIVDGEERTIDELLALPEAESESLVEFQGILVALPGETGVNPEGPGTSITVSEAGRYAVVCFIPQGADPAEVQAAMAEGGEGPPDMGDGTPHAFLGMATEFQVEG